MAPGIALVVPAGTTNFSATTIYTTTRRRASLYELITTDGFLLPNAELEERMSSLGSQLHELGATWRDQEHRKFSQEFELQMKAIARYVEATDHYVPYLIRKAERIEDYLQQR